MKQDASHELQVAIVSTLKADVDVSALVSGRIYDVVPAQAGSDTAQFPYVSFGGSQDLPEGADCIDASDLTIQLNVWSRDPGFAEGRKIAKAVRRALDQDALSLTDNALVYFTYLRRDDIRAPDGLTTQIAMTFSAGIENH